MDELIFILENLLDVEDKMKKSDMQNALAELLIIKICSYRKEKYFKVAEDYASVAGDGAV